MAPVVRLGLRAVLLFSITFVLMNAASVQAQNATGSAPEDFPIGLVVEYDLEYRFSVSPGLKSHIKCEVTSWVRDQQVVEIVYSGGWGDSGTWHVELPSWSTVYSNGTPTGTFMDPLWVDVGALNASQLIIPPESPKARLYSLTSVAKVVQGGAFICWDCGTNWTEQGMDISKHLYYETTLGVLVEQLETGLASPQGLGDYDFRMSLAGGNIQSFMSSELPTSSVPTMILWFLMSVSVVAIPVALMVRLKS